MKLNPNRIDNALNSLFLAAAAAIFIVAQAVSLLDSATDNRDAPASMRSAQTQPAKPIAHA